MAKPPHYGCCRSSLASCTVATIFIISVTIVAVTVYLIFFRPIDPEISVTDVKLPSFSVANNSVSFTFSQSASVKNPNLAVFSHYNSRIQLLYYGNRVGFMFIPAGKIQSGRTKHMSASFSVNSLPLPPAATAAQAATFSESGPDFGAGLAVSGNRVGPTMEIESKLDIPGRVKVLYLFSHPISAKSSCRLVFSTSNGRVLKVRC